MRLDNAWPKGSYDEWVAVEGTGMLPSMDEIKLKAVGEIRVAKKLHVPEKVVKALLFPLDGSMDGKSIDGEQVDEKYVIDLFDSAISALNERRDNIIANMGDKHDNDND